MFASWSRLDSPLGWMSPWSSVTESGPEREKRHHKTGMWRVSGQQLESRVSSLWSGPASRSPTYRHSVLHRQVWRAYGLTRGAVWSLATRRVLQPDPAQQLLAANRLRSIHKSRKTTCSPVHIHRLPLSLYTHFITSILNCLPTSLVPFERIYFISGYLTISL